MSTKKSHFLPIFLEIGNKRIYAGAIDWPGWYGQGRDEDAARQALLRYGTRYQQAIQAAQLGFVAPTDASVFQITEWLPGNTTTDFGAPDVPPSSDTQPMDEAALQKSLAILGASWETLRATYRTNLGKELRKGPRGGGRELDQIVEHVLGAHESYLRRILWKVPTDHPEACEAAILAMAEQTSQALTAAVTQGLPDKGPRGGAVWKPRTFVRRAAWHILDHIWEIEDRVSGGDAG